MSDNLDLLIHNIITAGKYEDLRGAHSTLRTAAIHLAEPGSLNRGVFRFVLDYAEQYGRYPTYPELIEYVETGIHNSDDGKNQIADAARELAGMNIAPYQGSMAQMLDEVIVTARIQMHHRAFTEARSILGGSPPLDKWGKPRQIAPSARVDEAIKYINTVRATDFTLPPRSPEGSWTENAELSADAMIAGLRDTVLERAYTGLRHVDARCLLGARQEARTIGILGWSHHGKSLLMRQIAYNMRMAGKRVLYIALEEKAIHCWTRLAYIHNFDKKLNIPAASMWRHNPKAITPEHQDNFRVLTDDIQHGCGEGDIVVHTHRQWEDIVREVNTGAPYDALFIDYPGHLTTGQTGPKHDDAILQIFHEIQALSLTYKNGRGIVIVNGVQANKTAMGKADAAEGDDWGVYSDGGAFQQYTPAYQDLDVVMGVWLRGPLRHQSMLKISNLKNRGGDDLFPPHFISIDPTTSALEDLPGGPKCDLARIATYRQELEESKLEAEDIEAHG